MTDSNQGGGGPRPGAVDPGMDQRLSRMEAAAAARRTQPKVHIMQSQRGKPPRRMPAHAEKHRADQPIAYEIFLETHPEVIANKRRADDLLVAQLKGRINAAGITRRELYAFVGESPDALFRNQNQVYNLEYGLRRRPTITLECARRWLAVLGGQLGTFFQQSEDGWHDKLIELRDAVIAGNTDHEGLEAMARAAMPSDPNDLLVMETIVGPE